MLAGMLLKMFSPEDAGQLRDFFARANYTGPGILDVLKRDELLSRQLRNLPRLLYRTSAGTPLDILLRLFVLRVPVDGALVQQSIPRQIFQLFLRCGLVIQEGDAVRGAVMLTPFEKFWIVTDTYARLKSGKHDDSVLMINPTTCIGLQFAVRRHSRATLDLGTGCGLLALYAAGHSDQVIATDLTSRSVEFARFNSWLNGITNVECLQGDLFDPVAGRRFDLIIANPPFYITPSSKVLFAENPMELDGFCRRLVKEAPLYLYDGGYLQLLCEWVEIEGQPWQERLVEWFQGAGCDVLVLHGGTFDPADYAEERLRAVGRPGAEQSEADLFSGWMDYYRSRKVSAIHAGKIAMRKRSGRNWVHFERLEVPFAGQVGESVQDRFRNHDFVLSATNEDLLSTRFLVADGVQWRQIVEWKHGRPVQSGLIRLVQPEGLHFSHELGLAEGELVRGFDGERTLAQVIEQLTERSNTAADQVLRESLNLVRWLADRGFLSWR
jgi:hypothetical protein